MRNVVLVAVLALLAGCTQVGTGEVAVKTRFGKVIGDPLEPGLHGLNPFFERAHGMSTQTLAYVVVATAVSKDMQEVTTQVTVNYAMASSFANQVFSTYRRDFEVRVLAPTTIEAIKTATAQYNVEDLVSQRPKVKEYVLITLQARIAPTHTVSAVMLTDFQFSESFSNAIEAKVTASQVALQEKNNLEAEKYKAEQRVVQAEGEAKAIAIQAQAIQSQGGSAYVQLQWIKAWSAGAKVPQVMSDGNTMFMLDLSKEGK